MSRHITAQQAKTLREDATPGPWSVEDSSPSMDGRNFLIRQQGVPGIRISGHCYGHNGDPELVAAAPDLAETVVRNGVVIEAFRTTIEQQAYQIERLQAALLAWKPGLDERNNSDLIDDLTEEGILHPGDMGEDADA